jgi:hypothetical protein
MGWSSRPPRARAGLGPGGQRLTLTDARLTADQLTNTAIGLGLEGDRLPTVPRKTAPPRWSADGFCPAL